MEVSISASPLSPSSRGRTLGEGKLSIASACLFAMQLKSQADVGSTTLELAFRSDSQWRSLYHCSFSTILRSRFALPSLYFFKVNVAFCTASLPMGCSKAIKPSMAPLALTPCPRSISAFCFSASIFSSSLSAVGRGDDCLRSICSPLVGCVCFGSSFSFFFAPNKATYSITSILCFLGLAIISSLGISRYIAIGVSL